jgi:hypothetical protein
MTISTPTCSSGTLREAFSSSSFLRQVQQGSTATGHDAFIHSRLGGAEGIFDAQLAVFEFGFGGRTDLDDGDTARQLSQPFGEFSLS